MDSEKLKRDLFWGIGWSLAMALFFSVIAAANSEVSTAAADTVRAFGGLDSVITSYVLGALFVGTVLGICRRWLGRPLPVFLVGTLCGTVIYFAGALAVDITLLEDLGLTLALAVLGGAIGGGGGGLMIWYTYGRGGGD